jgi:hypothetical protein
MRFRRRAEIQEEGNPRHPDAEALSMHRWHGDASESTRSLNGGCGSALVCQKDKCGRSVRIQVRAHVRT